MKTFKLLVTIVAMTALTMLLFWGFAVGTRITRLFWLSDILYFIQGLLMAAAIISLVFLLFYIFYKAIEGGLGEIREEWENW